MIPNTQRQTMTSQAEDTQLTKPNPVDPSGQLPRTEGQLPQVEADQGETPEQREQAQARAEACWKVIEKTLEEHNCVVQTYLATPEWIGDWGDKLMMSCTYGIRPLPAKPE